MPRVSVILPTYNGERDLEALLPALASQEVDGGLELVAIDSSSTDGTRGLLERSGARVEVIPKSEFSHSGTRNRAARSAAGEVLVFFSQDVRPRDPATIAELVRAFDDDRVAGAYSRVLPHPGSDPLAVRTVMDLPEASDRGFVRELNGEAVWEMDGDERARVLRFNNVASAIRASVFRDIPFPSVSFAEDFAWAARALTAGHRIAFVAESVVYHGHEYSMGSAFERYRVDAAFHRQVHGWTVRPTAMSAARGFLYEVREDLRFLKSHPVRNRMRHSIRSPILRAAQVLGQYFGSRGWDPSRALHPTKPDQLF